MKMKLHSPTFHIGGSKYKPSQSWSSLKLGGSDNGRLKFRYRQGWREHSHHSKGLSSQSIVLRSIRSLVRPQASAMDRVIQGNYKNPLRSTVYG